MPTPNPTETVLDRIVADVRLRMEEAKTDLSPAQLEARAEAAPKVRSVLDRIEAHRNKGATFVIAEVKKASPSKGIIRPDFRPVEIAQAYDRGGAGAISVLTEVDHFQGSLEYLAAIRAATDLPLLRKDFIVDPYQILQARAAGADFFLLLAVLLDENELKSLSAFGEKWGMTALVEVHDAEEMEKAIAVGANLIGVNNRNLKTFETRLETFEALAPSAPNEAFLVAESGIFTRADIDRLRKAGADAFLIGESLMRQDDPGAALGELIGRN